MRNRFLRGSTAANNGLTLPEGRLSIDLEKHAIRLHDGATPGGFEMVGSPIEFPAPGPTTFQGGDTTAGFYGEVPGTEFISYGDLSSQVGLSAGTLQHDTESAWLKFALDGQTLFMAKKPPRYNLSWEHLYQAGIVYGIDGFGSNPEGTSVDQGVFVTIAGRDYRVRLLKGAAQDPSTDNLGYDIVESHGSEWNRLMYPVHSGVHSDSNNPATHSDPSADPFASWATYSDTDLVVDLGNNGGVSWTQETAGTTTQRIRRGINGVTYFTRNTATSTSIAHGWRPVLELVE